MDSDVCLMLLATASHLANRLLARTTRQTPFGRCQRPYTRFEYTHTHTPTQRERHALTVNIHCQFAGCCCWRRHPQREIAGNCFASGRNRLSLRPRPRARVLVGLLHIPAHIPGQNICRMSEVVSDGTPHTLRGRWAGIVFTFSLQAAPRVVSEIIHNFPPRGGMRGMWHVACDMAVLSQRSYRTTRVVCLPVSGSKRQSLPDR